MLSVGSQFTLRRLGVIFCLLGAAFGALGLIGWLVHWYVLVTLVPREPAMVPNTAVCLLLLGSAGALRGKPEQARPLIFFSACAAIFVLTIGIGTLIEYIFSLQTGFDQLIISSSEGPRPGRMSPLTATALSLLGSAILIFDTCPHWRGRPSEWLILAAGAIASTALLGQIFGAGLLYRLTGTPVIGVAVPTAAGLLLITWGLLLERPQSGVMNLVTSRGPGGMLLRRLAPAAFLAPALFSSLAKYLMDLPSDTNVDLLFAALTVLSTFASVVLLAITAAPLDRAHATIEQLRIEASDLIDRASDGIFIADLSGRYTDVNRAGCLMLGYRREEIVGKSIVDLIPPADVERLRAHKERLLETHPDEGPTEVAEWLLRKRDGSYLPVEISAKILPDRRWQAFVRDISDRKRGEEERQFLLELGASLPATLDVDEAASIIADLCVRDVADFCLIDILDDSDRLNRVRASCRDHARDDLLCSALAKTSNDPTCNSGASLRRLEPRLIQTLTPQIAYSWGLNDEQGSALQSRGFKWAMEIPLLARGKELGRLILIATDGLAWQHRPKFAESLGAVTALSLDNKRLYRNAMLATRARDDMLGIVAHDLRNPLQVISIDASALRRNPEPEAKSIGDDISAAVRRMNRLIQDLLDVTRIETGKLTVKPSRCPVSELIEDTIHSQEVLASAAAVQIRTAIPNAVPEVLADRDRILQVFENLISNALKFTEPGGEITLNARARDGEVEFSVSDTGPGIAEADLPHVFDRFWQGSVGKRHGAGLGLAIVKGIVEAHGGQVRVTSIVGKGSTFYFTLPRAPVAKRSLETASPHRLGTV